MKLIMENWKKFLKENRDGTEILRRSDWEDIESSSLGSDYEYVDVEDPRTVGQLIMDEIANVLGVGPDNDIALKAAAAVSKALGLDARKQLDQLGIEAGEPGWVGVVAPEEFPEKAEVDRKAANARRRADEKDLEDLRNRPVSRASSTNIDRRR